MTRTPATPATHAPQQNRLLAALSPEERDRLYPRLQLVPMPPGPHFHLGLSIE